MRHARIKIPDQGWSLRLLQWKGGVLTTRLPGETPQTQLLSVYFYEFGQTFTAVQPPAQIQNVFITNPLVPSSLVVICH